MGKIEFRAWHKPTQLMDDVVLIDFYNEKIGILYADPVMQCESIQKYNFNEVEITQYTGKKDRYGTKIYEGDIVHWKDMFTSEGWEDTYKVVWQEEEAGFYTQSLSTPKAPSDPLGWYDNCLELEVIGNVYEDKEFLKGFENE